uniref:Uncharacterized protein n=1 Tax=Parascaris univalens TaxID=6257 RepID=A0A915A6K0_PARUN
MAQLAEPNSSLTIARNYGLLGDFSVSQHSKFKDREDMHAAVDVAYRAESTHAVRMKRRSPARPRTLFTISLRLNQPEFASA